MILGPLIILKEWQRCLSLLIDSNHLLTFIKKRIKSSDNDNDNGWVKVEKR